MLYVAVVAAALVATISVAGVLVPAVALAITKPTAAVAAAVGCGSYAPPPTEVLLQLKL